MLGKVLKAYGHRLEVAGEGGEPLTIVHLLRRLDPLPEGLSEGARRYFGELEDKPKPTTIEDLASAKPEDNADAYEHVDPKLIHTGEDQAEIADRELAAIHFANRDKHKP